MLRFPSIQRWRPAGVRSVRLTTGLVLFTYVGTHLLNHSRGNISLAWLERGLLVQKFIWQGWLGTAVLYSALVTHFFLGLWALYERRSLHWKHSSNSVARSSAGTSSDARNSLFEMVS